MCLSYQSFSLFYSTWFKCYGRPSASSLEEGDRSLPAPMEDEVKGTCGVGRMPSFL